MKIAAFVNAGGEVADFFEDGRICLFSKAAEGWEKIREIPLAIREEMGLGEVKHSLAASVAQMKDCDLFVLRDLRGGIKAMLEDHGFRVWKSNGALAEQLDNVALREMELVVIEQQEKAPIPGPDLVGELRDARYKVNLVELLQSGMPHVSRDVLMPFFETVAFQRLEIICQHIPKWFAMEFPGLGLRVDSTTADASGNEITVVVVPACGKRSCPPGKQRGSSGCHCG